MNEEIFVWRLESKDGSGVYQSVNDSESLWNISTNNFKCSKRNPTFFEDVAFDNVIIKDIKNCSFGFLNLEQYHNWVFKKEWRKELSINGVMLRKYIVEDGLFLESRYQVLFRKDFSTMIEELKPDFKD